MYENKIKWCPICNQGWIEIVKEVLFCWCSECESEWDDPENISKESCNNDWIYGQICEADENEISSKGWTKYII